MALRVGTAWTKTRFCSRAGLVRLLQRQLLAQARRLRLLAAQALELLAELLQLRLVLAQDLNFLAQVLELHLPLHQHLVLRAQLLQLGLVHLRRGQKVWC